MIVEIPLPVALPLALLWLGTLVLLWAQRRANRALRSKIRQLTCKHPGVFITEAGTHCPECDAILTFDRDKRNWVTENPEN